MLLLCCRRRCCCCCRQNVGDDTCTLWPELVLRFHLFEEADEDVGHTFVLHFLPEGGVQVCRADRSTCYVYPGQCNVFCGDQPRPLERPSSYMPLNPCKREMARPDHTTTDNNQRYLASPGTHAWDLYHLSTLGLMYPFACVGSHSYMPATIWHEGILVSERLCFPL